MSDPLTRWNRRVFLRNLCFAGAAAAAGPSRAQARPRRHLINIVVRGGWDAFWFHNAVLASEVAGRTATVGALVSGGQFVEPPGSPGYTGVLGPARALHDEAPAGWPFHVRCPDAFIRPHPHQADAPLGPGFADFTATDLSDLCMWKGIRAEGGHDTGNRILQTGAPGDQTSGFPALIAAELAAQRGLLPLHYTQLAGSRAELCNQKGPLSLGDPVMLPDLATWQALTAPGSREPSATRRGALDVTLGRLSRLGRLAQPSNQAAFEAFAASHAGAVELMLSGHATGADFTSTLAAYQAELAGLASAHLFASWFPGVVVDSGPLAFRFALAEFLVRHDLAAVVDLPGLMMDFHVENDADARVMLANLTALKLLVRRLKAAVLPDGSTALDCTTVVMHTEMERSPTLVPNYGNPRRAGTQHWDLTTSVLLAGAGIAGGRVVGDFARPAGDRFPGFSQAAFTALPLDLSSGRPKLGGVTVSVRSLFSTLLRCFDASARSQLQIGAPVVDALLR